MNCKFELEHIGINTPNAEEAAKLAELLCMMFGLAPRHGNKSELNKIAARWPAKAVAQLSFSQ